MKNFNIFGIHRKIGVLRGSKKKTIYGGDCQKRGFGWFADLRGGNLARKRGWCFSGGVDASMHTMSNKLFCLNRFE